MKTRKNKQQGLTVNPANFATAIAPRTEVGELTQNYEEVVGNIEYYNSLDEDDEDYLPDEEAEELLANVNEEYRLRLEELMYGDEEDDEEELEYSDSSALATFSAGTGFGQALLELADEEFEDPLEGLAAVADAVGISEETLVGIIQGEFYPEPELAQAIAECFDTTSNDEDYYNGFMVLADEARQELSDDEEDYQDEDDEEAVYSQEVESLRQQLEEQDQAGGYAASRPQDSR